MQSDSSTNSAIILYINDKVVSFHAEEDVRNVKIEPTSIQLRMIVPQSYDPSGLSISIGDDLGFKGFDIRLRPACDPNNYVAAADDLSLICGMRLIGRSSLNLLYFGVPLVGYSTFVWFEPRAEICQYVQIMRQEFEKDNQAILDIYGLTNDDFIFEEIEDEELCETSLAKFAMIVQLYKDAKHLLNMGLEQLDSQLVASSVDKWYPIQNIYSLSSQQILQAYMSGEPFYKSQNSEINIPLKVPVRESKISFNTLSNRYIAYILKDVIKQLEELCQLLEDEMEIIRPQLAGMYNTGSYMIYLGFKMGRLQQAHRLCGNFIDEIDRFLQMLIDLGVDVTKSSFNHEIANLKRTYRWFVNAYRRYQSRLHILQETVFLLEPSCSFQTRSVNYLYELWVTQRILRILVEKLGFSYLEQSKNDKLLWLNSSKSNKGIELKGPKDGQYVKFYFNRRFPRMDKAFCVDEIGILPRQIAGETRFVAKNNPDICLEFYQGSSKMPKMIIFDATFSNNEQVHKEKGYYKMLIWYRPSYDAPKSKWKSVVLESIAVHPYKPNDELPLDGEWPLVPGMGIEDSALFLEELLSKYGLIK